MTAQPGNQPAPGDTLHIGVILHAGRYRVREKLGQGGMGSVYLAEDTRLPGRLVAVKENSDASTDAQAQFKREALLLARLRHPNLPQVTDYFAAASGKQYLVMDYVPGDNLTELMRKRQGPLPVDEAMAIVAQVMQALAYMHSWRDPDTGRTRPIIHRDIKPANIKRTPEGRVVLVDFGIAKVDSNTMTGTAVSAKALTPGYAPLEQYGGGTDARSDIYALGATLYALLTGKAPPSATDMAMAGSKQRAPLMSNLKSLPPAIAKVIERAMQSLPEGRYQDIVEMHQALYNRPLTLGGVSPSSSADRSTARPRWQAFVIGVLALLLAGGVGWVLAGQIRVNNALPPPTIATAAPRANALPAVETAVASPDQPAAVLATELPASAFTPAPVATATLAPSTATVTPTATATSTAADTATPDATATAFEQEVLRRVRATQTAVAGVAVVATQTAQAPTVTPSPTLTPLVTATATPTLTLTPTPLPPECRVVSPSLNLRSGPGVVYDPPLAALGEGATLIAIGRTLDATWLAVEVPSLGQTGWVNADTSYVACNVEIAGLPGAAAPPTPIPSPTPTLLPQLIVDAQASSGNPVRVQYGHTGNGLAPGQVVYSDRGYTYSGAPASLLGATYLATPNNDAETEENNYQLVLTINRPATILVAFSDGYAVRPGWLHAFSDTGLDLTFVDQKGRTVTLSAYARSYPAGQVVLGGNTPTGSEHHSMYTVVIQ